MSHRDDEIDYSGETRGDFDDYHSRPRLRHSDGTPKWTTPADRAAEIAARAELGRHWGCEIHSFGELSPVDWYAVRAGRLFAVLEFKRRPTYRMQQFPTSYLSLRKWLTLQLAMFGLGVDGYAVVRYLDQLAYAPLRPTGRVSICRLPPSLRHEDGAIEPVVELPLSEFVVVPRP